MGGEDGRDGKGLEDRREEMGQGDLGGIRGAFGRGAEEQRTGVFGIEEEPDPHEVRIRHRGGGETKDTGIPNEPDELM